MSKCNATSLAASSQLGLGNSVYHGYTVTVTTATGPINIRNGTVTGTIIDVIPATTAAGITKYITGGVTCDDGLYVEFNGGATGTVAVLFE